MKLRDYAILGAFAVVVWAFCGAIMGIGPQVTSMNATLAIHAFGGPLGAGVAAWIYTRQYGAASPIGVAIAFVGIALLLDFFVVSMLVMGTFDMFGSVVGLWLPMALILVAAYAGARLAAERHAVA